MQIRSVRAPMNRAYQVNCNPDCNPACCSEVSARRVHAVMSPQMVLNLMGIAADDLDHSEGAELGNADSIPRSSRAPSPRLPQEPARLDSCWVSQCVDPAGQ